MWIKSVWNEWSKNRHEAHVGRRYSAVKKKKRNKSRNAVTSVVNLYFFTSGQIAVDGFSKSRVNDRRHIYGKYLEPKIADGRFGVRNPLEGEIIPSAPRHVMFSLQLTLVHAYDRTRANRVPEGHRQYDQHAAHVAEF